MPGQLKRSFMPDTDQIKEEDGFSTEKYLPMRAWALHSVAVLLVNQFAPVTCAASVLFSPGSPSGN